MQGLLISHTESRRAGILRSIEANYLRARIVAWAVEYPWSSYRAHGIGAANEMLDRLMTYEELSSYPAGRQCTWAEKVHRPLPEKGLLKDVPLARERLGRLKEQNWRATHVFDVTIRRLDLPRGKQQLEVTWQRNARFAQWSQLSEGCYLLRSNLTDLDAATFWKRYIQLTEAEWAFRITKDELEIRPIWHHKEDRVKAHILVCFLAYVLWKTLAGWMRVAGLGDAPRTLLYDLEQIKSADVILPAKTREGTLKTIRLRCVTEPDEGQAVLLDRLGLRLPRRLRRLDDVLEVKTWALNHT